jgi:flagellar M-ring protein FliF
VEFLRQLTSGVRQAWQRLTISARINLIIASLLTIGLVGFMVFTASQPNYVRLYDGVNAEEMNKIIEALNKESIPYKMDENTQAIMVPLSNRSRAKMVLGSQELPSSQGRTPGFEIFEKQDIMANRWLQDVRYMRAVQGELQRQLNEFEFVKKSFVFIREAKEELFISQQKPSEAAVTLDVKRPLSKQEIKAVLHTISSFGGANLNVNNITLTTTDGTVLHLPADNEFASLANSKLEFVAELEKQREDRVVKDLEQLGVKAIVKVSAVVDFDSKTETVTSSEDGAVISTLTQNTTTKSKDALPQGAPGAMANLPEGAAASGGAETQEENKETVENFEPSKTETKTVHEPGKVLRYVVGAIIEGETKKTTSADGKETTEYAGLTPEKKKAYEDFIIAAVGQGEEPTKVTVSDQAFDIAKLTEARAAFQEIERARTVDIVLQYGMSVVKLLLVIMGFFAVRSFLRRAIVVPAPPVVASVEEETSPLSMPTASPEDIRREEVAAEVARLSEQEPDAVAALLRSWLSEEE